MRGLPAQLSARWKQGTPIPQPPPEELCTGTEAPLWAGGGANSPFFQPRSRVRRGGMRVHHALRPEGSGAASSLLCGCLGVRGQQRPSLGGCRREAGGWPALCSQGTDRVEGRHPLFPYSGRTRILAGGFRQAACAPGCSPLPAGSMVTFSLLLPRPAEVTAATHSRYCCPRFRWAIR